MAITITARAPHQRLTTLGRLKHDMGLTDDLQDPWLLERIDEASQTVVDACRRPFAREALTETLPGDGGTVLQLARTPVVAVSSVALDGAAVTDYLLEDAEAGWLYREAGWDWTAQPRQWIAPFQHPGTERPAFSVSYTAGYLLPEDDVAAPVTATALDASFNLATGAWPLLVAGDRITTSGFATAANNGAWTVATRTTLKVTVSEAGVVDEAAADDKVIAVACRTLPGPVGAAAAVVARQAHLSRGVNPAVASRSVGGLSISYRQGGAANGWTDLPPEAVMLLRAWIRKR